MSAPPFEGPEKLLEIWFAPSSHGLAGGGLKSVPRAVWEDMLDIVKCKVLSVVHGEEIDAYLLSESSLFVSPHRLILKTCGTTLNLLGLPRILEIAANQAQLPAVHRCFYSRKSFMFPERQLGPHRDWKHEVEFLDNIFPNGSAYTVGKVNGDHWLLYMAGPTGSETIPSSPKIREHHNTIPDYTIEILMSDLAPSARDSFFPHPSFGPEELSASLGISDIFPSHLTTLDSYSFSPCGYSANALVKWGEDHGEGYYTIHVTPEAGWSYASFECNVPLPPFNADPAVIPDLLTLVRRVVAIFCPGRLSLTLFISSDDNEADNGDSAVEAAQRAFKAALMPEDAPVRYRRTDKINYEFGGYDLAFASFELKR
ncbi:PPM-type phosphatase domain-containing protein [Mycena indigotica]|uniref:S-adenosylmethionine decarboxylase proenzyme n=1 Tax=Mycena indigotica TaxID=2126181 RepID=A0A8H6TD58_9AGAR|nr:PPM-type phosphatase domain-containing protein [Mycena indigotica]KAF7315300.1 PPM-type phosphatase domain-containing protein [Mycena indigotica]